RQPSQTMLQFVPKKIVIPPSIAAGGDGRRDHDFLRDELQHGLRWLSLRSVRRGAGMRLSSKYSMEAGKNKRGKRKMRGKAGKMAESG
ncbi:MAG: hypothetical protein IKQ82_05195, partial [Lentisphaeria bacterium]|nr:hypothetical protein [Lentisphaeria bacterium]